MSEIMLESTWNSGLRVSTVAGWRLEMFSDAIWKSFETLMSKRNSAWDGSFCLKLEIWEHLNHFIYGSLSRYFPAATYQQSVQSTMKHCKYVKHLYEVCERLLSHSSNILKIHVKIIWGECFKCSQNVDINTPFEKCIGNNKSTSFGPKKNCEIIRSFLLVPPIKVGKQLINTVLTLRINPQ